MPRLSASLTHPLGWCFRLNCAPQKAYPKPLPVVAAQSLSHVLLCDPRDCSTPGFLVLYHLLELAQTQVPVNVPLFRNWVFAHVLKLQ